MSTSIQKKKDNEVSSPNGQVSYPYHPTVSLVLRYGQIVIRCHRSCCCRFFFGCKSRLIHNIVFLASQECE